MKVGDHIWEATFTFTGPDDAETLILLEHEIVSIGPKQIRSKPIQWHRLATGGTSKARGPIKIHRKRPDGSWSPPLHETRIAALRSLRLIYRIKIKSMHDTVRMLERDALTIFHAIEAEDAGVTAFDFPDEAP